VKNKYQHNDDGTTFIFVESKSKHFPGKHTITIDTEDWDKVKEYRWSIKGSSTQTYPYAITFILHPGGGHREYKDGYRRRRYVGLLFHHLIIGKPPKGMVVDHVQHDGLDNRKENLRIVTFQQNHWNRKGQRNSSSNYKGVSLQKTSKKWMSQLWTNGKRIYIGSFSCEHEAALAYNKKAVELWGESALLNEVEIQ
jgi:hypothetical protein